jgi:hypothetical protein
MANPKSFYDLDYFIELSEKRLDQYTSAYQQVLGRFTNIIIIYSAVGIFLVPIIQDYLISHDFLFSISVGLFLLTLVFSIYNTIRLLMPVDIAYLQLTRTYYQDLRLEYESSRINDKMNEIEKEKIRRSINALIKSSYIDELNRGEENNREVFSRKNSFYYNALFWGLIAILPYIVCIGYHITRNDDKVQKVELINKKKT